MAAVGAVAVGTGVAVAAGAPLLAWSTVGQGCVNAAYGAANTVEFCGNLLALGGDKVASAIAPNLG